MAGAWAQVVYMSFMSQNFRLYHVSNSSVLNFRFSAHVSAGSVRRRAVRDGAAGSQTCVRFHGMAGPGMELPGPSLGLFQGNVSGINV